jgi:hypothetical protein
MEPPIIFETNGMDRAETTDGGQPSSVLQPVSWPAAAPLVTVGNPGGHSDWRVFGARLRHALALHEFSGDRELHRRLERIAGELAIPRAA